MEVLYRVVLRRRDGSETFEDVPMPSLREIWVPLGSKYGRTGRVEFVFNGVRDDEGRRVYEEE